MSRFNDDLHGIGDFPEWRPYSAFQLIGKLGIGGRGLVEQRTEITKWLAANEPHPKLLASLEAEQLIDPQRHSVA